MKKNILFLFLLLSCTGINAKSWRVGPASVVGMDFASINAAMSSSDVTKGDTLFLDQYYYESNTQTVNKPVTIIGTGYDTTLSDEGVVAYVSSLNLKSDDIVVKSLKFSYACLYNNDCTIDRCYVTSYLKIMQNAGMNHIYSSFITGYIQSESTSYFAKVDLQNCVVRNSGYCLYYLTSSIIKNNVLINNRSYSSSTSSYYYYVCYGVTNSEFSNNIMLQTESSYNNYVFDTTSGNAIEHNVLSCSSSTLSSFPTNKFGYGNAMSTLFECDGSYSNYYRIASNSVAKGYANDGGDCGCHGGMFGCPSGGRPQYIPYFSKVVVGSRAEDGKLPVSITVKIQEQ